jgi:hypothetical protein
MDRRSILSWIMALPFVGTAAVAKSAVLNDYKDPSEVYVNLIENIANNSTSTQAQSAHDAYLLHLSKIDEVKVWTQVYTGDCGEDPRVEAVARAICIFSYGGVDQLVYGSECGLSNDGTYMRRDSKVKVPAWWLDIKTSKKAIAAIDALEKQGEM